MPNNRHLLLVEDDPEDLKLAIAALEDNGMTGMFTIARDGAEALDFIYARGKFSSRINQNIVVFLDIKLPKVNGIEVIRQVKADPAVNLIPIIVLSSSGEEKDVLESYQAGANGYVIKPIDFNAFQNAFKQLCRFWFGLNESPTVIPTGLT